MQLLIDDVKLNLLLEKKKMHIGNKVAWDSILSAFSFLISVIFASYKDLWKIPGNLFKTIFMLVGIFFTVKACIDVCRSRKNSYNYQDLINDINTLNEITHNHSIVAIRDTFNDYANRFLVYDDPVWKCKLFINYKDNPNNESFIKEHLSRELKVNKADIHISYITQNVSEKVSARDNKRKVYCHKLFLITIQTFPETLQNDTFECDGRTYHWKSIVDLENDDMAMKQNSDIIRFVKENI